MKKKYESKDNINSISEINLFVYLFIFCTISSTSQFPWRQATVFLIGGETGFGDTRSPLTGKVCLYFIDRSITNEKKKIEDYNRPYFSAIPGLQFHTTMLEVTSNVWDNENLSNLVFFQFAVCLS